MRYIPDVLSIQYSCSQTGALRWWLVSKSLLEEKLASYFCSGCLREQLFHQPDASAASRNAGQVHNVCCQKKELANGTQGGFFYVYKYVFCSPREQMNFLCASLNTVIFYTLNSTCASILFLKTFAEEPWEDGYLIFHLLLIHQRKYCI